MAVDYCFGLWLLAAKLGPIYSHLLDFMMSESVIEREGGVFCPRVSCFVVSLSLVG